MATYTALEAMNLLDTSFGSDMLDSEEESDIEEDPSFPLPRSELDSEDEDTNSTTSGKCNALQNGINKILEL